MAAGDAIRKYVSGAGWQTVAPDNGGNGGSLPTGWTQDGDPADVTTEGGALSLGVMLEDASLFLQTGSIEMTNDDGDTVFRVSDSVGVRGSPADSIECFQASDTNGATVALDCDALPITGLADPTNAQDAATKNYVDTAAFLVAANQATHVADGATVDDLRDALVAAGLMAAV